MSENIFFDNIPYKPFNEFVDLLKDATKSVKDCSFAIHNSELNIILLNKDKIVELLSVLKLNKDLSFKVLVSICGVDYISGREEVGLYPKIEQCANESGLTTEQLKLINNKRFEVVYHLLSLKLNQRVRIKVPLEYGEEIESVTNIFSSASWFERETFDMFGIAFSNSPDPRRILTDYNFVGFPLRKDFPLTGFKQIRYDNKKSQIVEEGISLSQEYRDFDFEMPWKGAVYNIQKNNS
jgi:NADH-quinone oxidoreductase subunit C